MEGSIKFLITCVPQCLGEKLIVPESQNQGTDLTKNEKKKKEQRRGIVKTRFVVVSFEIPQWMVTM